MATWIIFVGCLIGAIIALYLGRFLFADYIRTKLDKSQSVRVKKWRIVDGMFITDGILLVSLLRLMFIPFGLVSYMLGVTSVSFCDYVIGSSVYIIKIALIVIVGCTVWEASEEASRSGNSKEAENNEIIILIVEIVITIVITVVVTIWAKNKLEDKFEEVEREEKKL